MYISGQTWYLLAAAQGPWAWAWALTASDAPLVRLFQAQGQKHGTRARCLHTCHLIQHCLHIPAASSFRDCDPSRVAQLVLGRNDIQPKPPCSLRLMPCPRQS